MKEKKFILATVWKGRLEWILQGTNLNVDVSPWNVHERDNDTLRSGPRWRSEHSRSLLCIKRSRQKRFRHLVRLSPGYLTSLHWSFGCTQMGRDPVWGQECVVQECNGGWDSRTVVVIPVSSRLLNALSCESTNTSVMIFGYLGWFINCFQVVRDFFCHLI